MIHPGTVRSRPKLDAKRQDGHAEPGENAHDGHFFIEVLEITVDSNSLVGGMHGISLASSSLSRENAIPPWLCKSHRILQVRTMGVGSSVPEKA
jgi:hypothetical protein